MSVSWIRSQVKDALTNTEQVYGELDMTDLQSADNMKKMQNAMMLPEGQSLKTILTADQMKRLNAYLQKTMSVDMSSPMVEKQMGKLTPQAFGPQLTLLMFMTKHMGSLTRPALFDQYFSRHRQRKTTGPWADLKRWISNQDLVAEHSDETSGGTVDVSYRPSGFHGVNV